MNISTRMLRLARRLERPLIATVVVVASLIATPSAIEAQSSSELSLAIETALLRAAGQPGHRGLRAVVDASLSGRLPAANSSTHVGGLRTVDQADVVACEGATPLERQCWFRTGADADVIFAAVHAAVDGEKGFVDIVTKTPHEGVLRGERHRWVSEGASRYHLGQVDGEWTVVRVEGLWIS